METLEEKAFSYYLDKGVARKATEMEPGWTASLDFCRLDWTSLYWTRKKTQRINLTKRLWALKSTFGMMTTSILWETSFKILKIV